MEIEWDPDDALEARRQSVTQIEDQLSVVKQVEYLKRNEVQNKDICVLVKDEGRRKQAYIPDLQGAGFVCQNAEELYTKASNNKVVFESIRRFKLLDPLRVVFPTLFPGVWKCGHLNFMFHTYLLRTEFEGRRVL